MRTLQADRRTNFAALRACFQEESVQGRPGLRALEILDAIAKGHGTNPCGHTLQARDICCELLSLVHTE